jgi:CRISPR-associated protein Csx3
MKAIALTVIPHHTRDGMGYQHIRIEIISEDGIVEPDDLKSLELPPLDGSQGVVFEGKSPIWVYAYLTHEAHATAWVGCYDPRLNGAVVVATHTRGVGVGSVLPLELPA